MSLNVKYFVNNIVELERTIMSKIKEIWCMHHSHLDIGYTHPQPMLMELQGDYIENAIELCMQSRDWPKESQFRWTCEVTYPVLKWMEHADTEKIEQFKQLISENRISIAALPMHTTPCSTMGQMLSMMKDLDKIRECLGSDIKTAVNHDVNGQPWTLSQILLDSGVDFYMTGINIHFGGVPFKRPMAFRWKTPDGRELLSYIGEHYSLFSQFFHTYEADTAKMHEGIVNYTNRLEKQNHEWDFALLTATNPPLFDNNSPDAGLADLIRRYNEEGHEFKVRFVTPEMLRDKLFSMGMEQFPVYEGDWTDYWNFGCASTARETKVNRLAQKTLQTAGVLECAAKKRGSRYNAICKEAELNSLIYSEHTWGASQSVSDPNDYESQSQVIQKKNTAYRAADLAGYLVGNQMEKMAGNPFQSDEMKGILVVNPTGVTQEVVLNIPKAWMRKERQLSAVRAKRYIPYLDNNQEKAYYANEEKESFGAIELKPYGYEVIPFTELYKYDTKKSVNSEIYMKEGELITPFYKVRINDATGRIEQIYDLKRKRDLIDEQKGWGFFEAVRETIDTRFHKNERRTLFPRDVDLCNENISMWNHEWKADRRGVKKPLEWKLDIGESSTKLVWSSEFMGTGRLEQQAVFYKNSGHIDLNIKLIKKPVHTPESIYLVFPLKMKEGWDCSFNTAGQFVRLDEEQLGHVSRDYVTVDNGVAVYDETICFGLACPHAPMVQIGDFNFGKEQSKVERRENPLLLAWPLNNYWDTNFEAAQSGAMEFSYRFFCMDKFNKTEAYKEFVKAENQGIIGAAVKLDTPSACMIECSEEGSIASIYPAKNPEEGMIVVLKNQEAEEKNISFCVPGWNKVHAVEVNIQEQVIGRPVAAEGTVNIVLKPNALKLIHIKQQSLEND